MLLQFADVISIGGYGETNLILHAITVNPGTTPIKMKHCPLNSVMEESLRQQIDRWLEQRVVEEADFPWSFPLVPVPKKEHQGDLLGCRLSPPQRHDEERCLRVPQHR